MSTALIDADKRPATNTKRKRERITLVEVKPQEDWFVQATDEWGRRVWFVRVSVTGFHTRRYGPFPTKRRALLFLDRLLDEVGDGLMEAANCLDEYQIPARQYAQRMAHYPVVEDELITATQKGQ